MKRWDEMSRDEKRVAIAQDVLDRIKKGYITGMRRAYLTVHEDGVSYAADSDLYALGSGSFYRTVREAQYKPGRCSACALGSLFIAATMRNESGGPTLTRIIEQIEEDLTQYFSWKELALIELAFEGNTNGIYVSSPPENMDIPSLAEVTAHISFFRNGPGGLSFYDDEDRLRIIMENIVRNGGRFVVGDGPQ